MNEVINNQYTLIKKIGEGGMGSVYLAEDILLQRQVAIKCLNNPRSEENDSLEGRFQQEALALAKLNHPNITHVYTFIRYQDAYWMVMEYVEGETLENWIRHHGAISTALACSITDQILEGLHHAHYKGIIHRDLKPANIMISDEGEVKIMDFGIARIRNSQRLTQHGKSVGTLEYMAPEQIQGKEGDEVTDVYAAGNMLFEMLTGETPFNKDTDYQLMKAKLEQKVALPPGLISITNTELQQVIAKSLERNPEKRYPDILSFRNELRQKSGVRFLNGRELYNALQHNLGEDAAIQNETYDAKTSSLQNPLHLLSSAFGSFSIKLKNTVQRIPILDWKGIRIGGRIDKSVILLITIVVICLGLVIWNLTRKGASMNPDELPKEKVNYQVNLEDNYIPQPPKTNIIERQILENQGAFAVNDNKQSEGTRQQAPSPRKNKPTKVDEGLKERETRDKKNNTPVNAPVEEEKSNGVKESRDSEEKPIEADAPSRSPVVIPRGMDIRLVLQDELTSENKSKDGSLVRLSSAEDVKINDQVLIPKGATAIGKIVDVVPSAKRKKGLIGFIIIKVVARDGGDIRLSSERFRLKAENDNEAAIFRSGKIFIAKIHKERLVK